MLVGHDPLDADAVSGKEIAACLNELDR